MGDTVLIHKNSWVAGCHLVYDHGMPHETCISSVRTCIVFLWQHLLSIVGNYTALLFIVSRKQVTRFHFDKLDVNGDGYIDRAEAVKMLEPNGFVEARRHIVYVRYQAIHLEV